MSDGQATTQADQPEGGFRESFRWDVIRSTPCYAYLLITVTFLSAVDALGKDIVFWIYAAFAVVGIVFARAFVPETKGRSLEEIETYWTQGHRWPGRGEASRGKSPEPGSAPA